MIILLNKIEMLESVDPRQITLSDIFDRQNIPIGPGDYVEHESKPGVMLEVISEPYTTSLGNVGINVKDDNGKKYPVIVNYLKRVR